MNFALVGNPNSGKTTLFNKLTGSNQYVGNWPGVTVEKKEGKLKSNKEDRITDLPGIYSLSPYTLEEVITRDFLIDSKPDVIINIIDATNLERNLYLTTQILELGIPTVVALNMMDVVEKNGDKIDVAKLSAALSCPVVPISAMKNRAIDTLVSEIHEKVEAPKFELPLDGVSQKAIAAIEEKLNTVSYDPKYPRTWLAEKILERDDKIHLDLAPFEEIVKQYEEDTEDDGQGMITDARYTYLTGVVPKLYTSGKKEALSTSDKIDRVVTNRWLALPIFALVMFVVYFLSITTIGTLMTDWVNDSLFGDGFFFLGMGAGAYEEDLGEFEEAEAIIGAYLDAANEEGIDIEPVEEALEFDADEYEDEAEALTAQEEADAAIEDFLAEVKPLDIETDATLITEDGDEEDLGTIGFTDFEEALSIEEPDPGEYGPWVNGVPVAVESGLESINTAPWLQGLIVDGIIAGVGAVLGFLPQMLVLFLLLAFLEDCGYMSRIAFIMDRIFRKFGLSGKSFIPMLISTGCAVPGIMASRTIENDNDRRMTVMTTAFMPCGAKLPIIALIAGALFPGSIWVAPSAYFIGVAAIIVSGIMLKKTKMFAGDPAPFVMELPAYHMPGIRGVLRTTFSRGWAFVKKAGTIVLLATIGVWFLSTFSWSMQMVEADESILASIGNVIAPIFAPLGWGNWRAAVATFTGLIAKENVVGTFGILYGYGEVAENGLQIWQEVAVSFTQLSAFSFLLFNLLCAPCFAAIGAIRREMNSARWTWFAIGYMCVFAYVIALIVYQLGMLFTGSCGVGSVVAILLVIGLIYMLFRKPSGNSKLKKPAVTADVKSEA